MFSAVAEQLGMDYQTAVKLSCGFGGGMGLGSVCGAVTGGIMAIGLAHGGVEQKSQMQTLRLVREFVDRFKSQHRSINCPDLVGFDLGKVDVHNPEAVNQAYKSAMEKNAFALCPGLVRDSAKIASELVLETPK